MKDTNIVMDAGWHFVDLALWLFGESYASKSVSNRIEFSFNDISKIMITHNNGIWSEINLDYLRRDKSWGCTIVGKDGTLILGNNGNLLQWVSLGTKNKMRDLYHGVDNPDEMFKNQLDYLLKEEWKSNINDAMEVMKICS
jgi:predicted dehydrogenase